MSDNVVQLAQRLPARFCHEFICIGCGYAVWSAVHHGHMRLCLMCQAVGPELSRRLHDRFEIGDQKMAMHKGLPVAGYQPQSDARVDLVNSNKEVEERVLRMLDNQAPIADPVWNAIARQHIEIGFMAMNRAVFQPQRLVLEGDDPSGKR